MSTTLVETIEAPAQARDFAEELQASMAAVRLSLKWFGVRKSVTVLQRREAAETFDAATNFVSMGKKLIDTDHPAWKTLIAVRGKIVSAWKSASLPYPPRTRHVKIGGGWFFAWCPPVVDNEGALFAWEYWDCGIITDELPQLPSLRSQSRLRAKMGWQQQNVAKNGIELVNYRRAPPFFGDRGNIGKSQSACDDNLSVTRRLAVVVS